MEPMEAYFRERVAVQRLGDEGLSASMSFPPDLQGPPDTTHGGGVTAMLLELTRLYLSAVGEGRALEGAVSMEVRLHRALPLETVVQGTVRRVDGGWHTRIDQDERPIAEAELRPADHVPGPEAALRPAWEASIRAGSLVPAYPMCLGCGVQNARGAQVRFQYDDAWMWRSLAPQPHFRCADGRLFAGYLAIVCDELGWWLGALRQGECGVSNRLSITLASPAHGGPLLALGPRALVMGTDPRGRVWQTQTFVLTPDWRAVAAAAVQFVGSPGFTRLMLPRFLRLDDAGAVERAFPRAQTRR